MIEPAIIGLRLVQYAGATILFGLSLFLLHALPAAGAASPSRLPWARWVLAGGAALLALGSALAIAAQASLFEGSLARGFTLEAMGSVVSYMTLGQAAAARAVLALAALLVVILASPGRATLVATATLGAGATASLAWLGHAAATEGTLGWIHLGSDILHLLAATVWLGALAGFALLLGSPDAPGKREALHQGLHGFSGLGSVLVAVLLLTGVVNSWVLVGPDRIGEIAATGYGRLLLLKIALFLLMVCLAAANRFRHTPRLGQVLAGGDTAGAVSALRLSVGLEAAAGAAILAVVAWLGTLAPPAAG